MMLRSVRAFVQAQGVLGGSVFIKDHGGSEK